MNARLAVGLALVLFLSVSKLDAADAPPPANEAAKPAEAASAATGAASRPAPGSDLDGTLKPIADQLAQIQKDLRDIKAAQAAGVDPQQFARLQAQVGALQQRLSDVEAIVGDISRLRPTPGGATRYLLDVARSSDDPSFQADINQAVRKALPQQGTLRINNEMATDQDILVNGVRYRVLARTSRDFTVPAGSVTTQLPDLEGPRNWAIAAPNFFQQVNITPRVVAPLILEPIRVYPLPLLTVY